LELPEQALIDAGYTPEEFKATKFIRQGLHDLQQGRLQGPHWFV